MPGSDGQQPAESLDARKRRADLWQMGADERERLADERESLADEREALADERERMADRQEQRLDLREAEAQRLSGGTTSGPGWPLLGRRCAARRRARVARTRRCCGRARPPRGSLDGRLAAKR
jgi:hypothetical protein